jgi:hypothetical protein
VTGPFSVSPATARVGKVTIRAAAAEALPSRWRVEHELARADWSVPDLPPSALLVLRRLRMAPTPAATRTRGALAGRVSAALRAGAGAGRRPWLDSAAAAAGAVWFADEAELVACLVRDWLAGAVPARWWWSAVLGRRGPREWLRAEALGRGEVLVPALALLAATDGAVRWASALDDQEVEEAVRAVTRAFALVPPAPAGGVPAARGGGATDGAGSVTAGGGSRRTFAEGRLVAAGALARLLEVVPEAADPRLCAGRRKLLSLALAVTRDPAWARSPAFPTAMTELVDADGSPGHPIHFTSASPAPAVRGSGDLAVLPESDDTGQRAGTVVAGVALDPPPGSELGPAAGAAATASPLTTGSASIPVRDPTRRTEPEPTAHPDRVPAEVGGQPLPPVFGVHTRFGGIFYLLNAALALELYGDFTAPRAANLGIPPWDLLALAGRTWLGEGFAEDPVWDALARLAGRGPDTPPGAGFEAPTGWLVPGTWLTPWGDAPALGVHVTRTRVRVLHPAGFDLADVPRDPGVRSLRQARALCDALPGAEDARLRRVSPPAGRAPRDAAGRWLHRLLGFLRARLAAALDTASEEVPALLCQHPAEVVVTPSDVHVHLSLAGLPLAVRFAGLDRDAGWIPAAGRSLHFHFE